jgi:hypothetical protein
MCCLNAIFMKEALVIINAVLLKFSYYLIFMSHIIGYHKHKNYAINIFICRSYIF